MTDSRLRYVKADQVNAGGLNLEGLPLGIEGERQPVGELDGLVIDLAARRVQYLVVKASRTRRNYLMPLDATTVDLRQHTLERVSSDDIEACEPFNPSDYEGYDDDAIMALMFGQPAA